ncbi:TPA: hypothetical protein QDC27_000237 [Burkholderia cepacia ATCC 25416]|uniref:hypothetical protein n=1 Tax=Burkholderia cepacia TaxID=292 RepID=UPI001CF404DF|nr:hypothetical protein [Burkholderia cepacia]HDR9764756.1 hypothetical protein [Burkholderia cepacia ATCC 25416]MCA8075164.1 hypothetical protein [Burkholderia cepacia]HDR9772525.1 hypothetical protein [Burkholderia cepacia ATCC 25416]HDR9780310.1 hypothetical protein [Burkholderia cepacia ATCC 25416]HDR9789202.1 hypothetical protein [Burkholderia cepacia ATCC 25416]
MRVPLPENRVSGIARRSRAGYRAAGGGSTFAACLSFGRNSSSNSRPLSACRGNAYEKEPFVPLNLACRTLRRRHSPPWRRVSAGT